MNLERMQCFRALIAARVPGSIMMGQWDRCAACVAAANTRFQDLGLASSPDGPRYEGLAGYAALAAFFGITLSQAHYLFRASEYSTTPGVAAAEVLAHIDSLIHAQGFARRVLGEALAHGVVEALEI